jgi:phage internal scaffolding protein
MTRFKWRDQYDDEADAVERRLTDIATPEPSLTQQQFTDEVNLNIMVRRMGIDEHKLPVAPADPRYYGDFSDAVDFRGVLDAAREAAERFNSLPGDLRQSFNNDPAALHEWVSDPANAEEAVSIGLLVKMPAEPIRTAEPATPPSGKTPETPPVT